VREGEGGCCGLTRERARALVSARRYNRVDDKGQAAVRSALSHIQDLDLDIS
jgi:hypothetical protein